MSALSVAIVGAGNIAGGYDAKKQQGVVGVYSHAGAYSAHGGFKLSAVYDLDRQRAQDFCRVWDVDRSLETLSQLYEMRHDVISVCTPDETHAEIVRNILLAECCGTVFVEKPLAIEIDQVEELIELAEKTGIQVVVNFQRRHESTHHEIRELIASCASDLLSVSGHYMKGLRHIGVTMIDTLIYLCGYPDAVLTYSRAFNHEVGEYSYEFVLYYPEFTANVKTTDADRFRYNFHIFEIDLLFTDRRKTLVEISQAVREASVTPYVYSGVTVMNDREALVRDTHYKFSMQDAVAYIHAVTMKHKPHTINTPQSFCNNLLVVNKVIESFDRGLVKLPFERGRWKR